ncbi:zinc-binding dehydrogenase [Limosilactobacillus albertensis]|nr:zinc-binding dehydrogenase [Limosilactobacillus albertensis]MCD7117878.1 zinc-binding dehydrogenase [Limosilactobacillus albertensis]MCD7128426.1 zinc-binding dehydrogenase [Limosilactobacillus albertensis]
MTQIDMKAIKLTKPCSADELNPVLVPCPKLKKGYVLIKVKAFGVNESEVTSRKGESSADFSYPRILGIEGVGIIKEVNPNSLFKVGQKVATMMGGMGRAIDGSYAEYMMVKEENVIPLQTDLPWDVIGAMPEMLQTAYGSLTEGLQVRSGDTLLIRGGSSTVGLMAIVVGKMLGARVVATTRQNKKIAELNFYGADEVVIDDSMIAATISRIVPEGFDKALELVGVTTLFQDMDFLRDNGLLCFTGALAGKWTIENFSPFLIPKGKYLTSYDGGTNDLPAKVFNKVLAQVASGEVKVPIAKVYHGLEEVGQAQENLESGKYLGKHVVVLD